MAYWRTALYVDLSSGRVEEEEISETFLRRYIGGTGFATRVLVDEVDPGADPFDPENVLVVAPGLFVGPSIPTGSKTAFGFKSPLTQGYGKSMVGAAMGDELKRAGYDYLAIRGAADSPTTLVIKDDTVTLEDATDIWGRETRDTDSHLKDQHPESIHTAVIGPAGENLAKIAHIECEDRQAGRGGGGAVMGSKHLKAIVVSGSNSVPVADPDELESLNQKWRKETTGQGEIEVEGTGDATVDMQYGTGEMLDVKNTELGVFPTRNWQSGYFKRAYDRLEDPDNDRIPIDPRYWTEKYVETKRPCPYCTKPCSQYFEAEDTPYGDIAVDGPEYEGQYSLGSNVEVDDIEAVAKATELCDRLGLDIISVGNAISWAMEANERGLLDDELVDIEANLEFGNPDALVQAVRAIGRAEGSLGSLLKDGHVAAADTVGAGEELAVQVKNLSPAGFTPQAIKGMALAYGVAPRGADHMTACMYAVELGNGFWEFEGYDRLEMAGKAFALKTMEDLFTLYDITGMCKFTRGLTEADGILELTNVMTGFDQSLSELLTVGERVYTLSKLFNVREGFTKEDDMLPDRLMEPLTDGPSDGEFIEETEYTRELERYYRTRGWDTNGIPLQATLQSLDLSDVEGVKGASRELAVENSTT